MVSVTLVAFLFAAIGLLLGYLITSEKPAGHSGSLTNGRWHWRVFCKECDWSGETRGNTSSVFRTFCPKCGLEFKWLTGRGYDVRIVRWNPQMTLYEDRERVREMSDD